jgi:glycosyltransferase involved in cell wall biosynthesis
MKIAILTPTFCAFSGIDRVVELQAKELHKKGNIVTIFTLKKEMNSQYAKVIEIGLPKNNFISRLYRLFFFFDFIKIFKYGNLLKGYDKIFCHFYPMNWLALYAKKKFKIKYIYYNHGIAYPNLFKSFIERIYMRLFIFFVKLSVRDADFAISISKFMKLELKRETGLDSIVKYIKIDKKRFNKNLKKGIIRRKYHLKNEPICLYVGRISPHKGIDLLIKSFNEVLKKVPNAKLIIVGKETFDDYVKLLKDLAKKVNPASIIFTGFIKDKDLPYYYTDCNIYTTATLWEGYDLPCVEAQACGKPVVAFNLCSHPEVIKNGILINKNDLNGFAKAIIKIIKKNVNNIFIK